MEISQNIIYDEFMDKLAILHNSLVDLQNDQANLEIINEIFRSVHTIKSTSDLLGMFDIVSITHKAEDILDEIRTGNAVVNDKLVSLYFELEDFLKLSISNTSEGIYDDSTAQDLSIYLEHEFEKYLNEPSLLNRKNILVVESSSLNRYMIKKIVNDLGHDAYITGNGLDAFKKISNKEIDIIFADITDTCENCEKFLKNIKSDILYDHIPIIILVESMDQKTKEFAREIKAKGWLLRPVKKEQLTSLIEKLV